MPGGACPGRLGHILRLAAFSTVILTVACAGKEPAGGTGAYNAFDATRLFSVGYKDIANIYIDDVVVADLAVTGLKEVAARDPDLTIQRTRDRIAVQVDGKETRSFTAPRANDPDGWGSLTASALKVGRSRSPELRGTAPADLYESVFEGMLSNLDRYSRYAGAAQARENRANRDGFGGIGVRVRAADKGVRVQTVIDHSPAKSAGLQAGDLIMAIDGRPTTDLDPREVVHRLRGRIDTDVALTVRRERTAEPVQIAVKRAHVVPTTVEYQARGDAAYLRITGFNQNTADSLRRAVARAKKELGSRLAGYVLDLRDNPGGLLDQAVEVADIFVREGRIVSTHGRHPDSHQYFDADPDDLAQGLPVVALVNAASASASEIVAAALQDSGRAVVIGSLSFGKGTVQTVLRLPNEGELTLTWARFHAPSGYALSRRGVLPDICTSSGEAQPEDVMADLRAGRLPLRVETHAAAFDGDEARDEARDEAPDLSTALRARCPGRRDQPPADLEIALRLLHEPELYHTAADRRSPRLAQVSH